MAEKNIKSRIIHKHDIEANWNKATKFIPKQGEIIVYDIDEIYDYERFKIGDGKTVVKNLPFVVNVDSVLNSTSVNPVQNKVVNTAISNLNTLVGDESVSDQISNALSKKITYVASDTAPDDTNSLWIDTSDEDTEDSADWTQIYDSDVISAEVNAIANIDVSGYKQLKIAIKCVGTTKNKYETGVAVVFTGKNNKEYIFANIFNNLMQKTVTTTAGAADFMTLGDRLLCQGSYRSLSADNMLSEEEGTGADNLTSLSGGAYLKCTSPISKMMITNALRSNLCYFGVGSRVMVWGCKA